jgi:tRNA-uridine 2-sulfurtransferase
VRVLVAMSGGVDSSVAAALLVDEGHEVVGATLKLWGGPSDSGCCSVADVDDARRVAQQLGVDHHVFNMSREFGDRVVDPYVASHAGGRTPNPCIECNRHVKFDLLLRRARRLGFDALATGHHARVERSAGSGHHRLLRGADRQKDQSYVLSMLGQEELARLCLPVGHLTKGEVRDRAATLGLRTAAKPDSQDVCFVRRDEGRLGFLGARLTLHPGVVVDGRSGEEVGEVPAVELVTVGQRRGMGHGIDGQRRYVVSVDVPRRRVVVGGDEDVVATAVGLLPEPLTWVDGPPPDGTPVVVQVSAHGRPVAGVFVPGPDGPVVRFGEPQRPVAPGQTVALYDHADPDSVLGAGIAA